MATKVVKEMKSSPAETETAEAAAVSSVKCCCCGLMEDCTQAYIARVKERFGGRWICGLCAEAVKEERVRSSQREKMITMDEALKRHIKFCQQITSPSPHGEDLVLAVKQILFRTLDSPRKERFTCRPLGRSHSCFSTMESTPPQAETHME